MKELQAHKVLPGAMCAAVRMWIMVIDEFRIGEQWNVGCFLKAGEGRGGQGRNLVSIFPAIEFVCLPKSNR